MVTIGMNRDMIKGDRLRLELTQLKQGRLNLSGFTVVQTGRKSPFRIRKRYFRFLRGILTRQDHYSHVDLDALSERLSPGRFWKSMKRAILVL